MKRLDKIKLAIEKGITCDPITGKVYGVRGQEIKRESRGYIMIAIKNKNKFYNIFAHQFVYYFVHKKVVDCIDHINGDKGDNRIENLREVTHQENHFNETKAKGYSWRKDKSKYESCICLDGKTIHLGLFNTEQEAKQAYLDAKRIYHILK